METRKLCNITKHAALCIAACTALGSSYASAYHPPTGPRPVACCEYQTYEEAEQHAYMTGISAMEYGNPYVFQNNIRWVWTQDADYPLRADVNTFIHVRDLATSDDQSGGSPNNDTLYSVAWIDVSEEPMVLSHPKMAQGRYFSFQIANMASDNIGFVGVRTTGRRAGHFAIVGPDWEGRLPGGVQRIESDTNSILMLGRTGVDGPDDLEEVRAIQDTYRLAPLSQWDRHGNNDIIVEPTTVIPPAMPGNSTSYWQTMAAVMAENPPPARHDWLRNEYRHLSIGADLDVADADQPTQDGLERAFFDYSKHVNDITGQGQIGTPVEGWVYPPSIYGRSGNDNYFRLRASVQNIGGIIAVDPEEAVYLNRSNDSEGKPLDGDVVYKMTFKGDDLPPVDESSGFWSMTMYGLDFNLVENEIDRYSIGNRTEGLIFDGNGDLTIYLQSDNPGGEKRNNWLPSPAGELFYVIIRMYLPGEPVLEQVWAPGAIVQVD